MQISVSKNSSPPLGPCFRSGGPMLFGANCVSDEPLHDAIIKHPLLQERGPPILIRERIFEVALFELATLLPPRQARIRNFRCLVPQRYWNCRMISVVSKRTKIETVDHSTHLKNATSKNGFRGGPLPLRIPCRFTCVRAVFHKHWSGRGKSCGCDWLRDLERHIQSKALGLGSNSKCRFHWLFLLASQTSCLKTLA